MGIGWRGYSAGRLSPSARYHPWSVPDPDASRPRLDVVAIGSPLVDVLTRVDDALLDKLGMVKGSMELVDLTRAEAIYETMGPAIEVSGGSAANTVAGVAALGGTSGFVGKVSGDLLGEVFIHDIRRSGVTFEPAVADASGRPRGRSRAARHGPLPGARHGGRRADDGDPSRRCHHDRPRRRTRRPRVSCWDPLPGGVSLGPPPAKEAMRRAIEVAHGEDGAVALSLSDPFCVERHRREFPGSSARGGRRSLCQRGGGDTAVWRLLI